MELSASWTRSLMSLQETGMGYQVVEVSPTYGVTVPILVLNAEMAIEEGVTRFLHFRASSSDIREAYDVLREAPRVRFRVLSLPELESRAMLERYSEVGDGPAIEAMPVACKPEEKFLRFSAFANDRRILADGSLTAGTFATTWEDGWLSVRTGLDAVQRYALPNSAPAVNRFWLSPPQAVNVQRGTAQPAYGQPGGGVEVLFTNGAPANTLKKQDQIPAR